MINLRKKIYFFILVLTAIFLLVPNYNDAKEILIFADNITYDEDENIIARGNAKIFQDNQLILSDLIIYEKETEKLILPSKFILKDDKQNYYEGDNGFFENNLNYGEINNIKIKLNDGSRIIGVKGKRDKDIDIISKGVYSPCKSRIRIANFICPVWQLEGEKILHDNKNLFLYQKHSKMRVLNTPVFYIPYIVTPSPLRKNRKSGFLSPQISLNFFDTKTSQLTSFPYYFNISQDKELTFTPMINYGGGVDSSQRFEFDYNQIISGGNFSSDLTFDSNFEQQNNENWFSDASLITNFNKNLNDKYRLNFDSAIETKKNYIQITRPNDELSYTNSLSTSITLEGFNLNKIDDYMQLNSNFYQINQKNEDSKKIPVILPSLKYYTGNTKYNDFDNNGIIESYNIFREINTDTLSKKQQKISYTHRISRDFIRYKSKIILESEIYNQIYNTEKKLIHDDQYHTGSYYRLFPIFGISMETPFKLNNNLYNFTYKPRTQIILASGSSNSNKISNEDSSINNFSISNLSSLNRFSGSDKLDNSKRINYGFNIYNEKLSVNLSQVYEFTNNSNFHIEQGNNEKLSDLLGSVEYNEVDKNENIQYNYFEKISYNFRYDVNEEYLKEQNFKINYPTFIGNLELSYLDQNSKINDSIQKDTETLNYNFHSKKIGSFSKINFSGLYNLKKEINTEYNIGYNYFDECFGINIDFTRKSYKEDNLKPQDILTLMFSFKNIGSYKSTNLAVSETDKQDIEWESGDINNEIFAEYD